MRNGLEKRLPFRGRFVCELCRQRYFIATGATASLL